MKLGFHCHILSSSSQHRELLWSPIRESSPVYHNIHAHIDSRYAYHSPQSRWSSWSMRGEHQSDKIAKVRSIIFHHLLLDGTWYILCIHFPESFTNVPYFCKYLRWLCSEVGRGLEVAKRGFCINSQCLKHLSSCYPNMVRVAQDFDDLHCRVLFYSQGALVPSGYPS